MNTAFWVWKNKSSCPPTDSSPPTGYDKRGVPESPQDYKTSTQSSTSTSSRSLTRKKSQKQKKCGKWRSFINQCERFGLGRDSWGESKIFPTSDFLSIFLFHSLFKKKFFCIRLAYLKYTPPISPPNMDIIEIFLQLLLGADSRDPYCFSFILKI